MGSKAKLYEVISRMTKSMSSCPSDLKLKGLENSKSCEHINDQGLCSYECWPQQVIEFVFNDKKG